MKFEYTDKKDLKWFQAKTLLFGRDYKIHAAGVGVLDCIPDMQGLKRLVMQIG